MAKWVASCIHPLCVALLKAEQFRANTAVACCTFEGRLSGALAQSSRPSAPAPQPVLCCSEGGNEHFHLPNAVTVIICRIKDKLQMMFGDLPETNDQPQPEPPSSRWYFPTLNGKSVKLLLNYYDLTLLWWLFNLFWKKTLGDTVFDGRTGSAWNTVNSLSQWNLPKCLPGGWEICVLLLSASLCHSKKGPESSPILIIWLTRVSSICKWLNSKKSLVLEDCLSHSGTVLPASWLQQRNHTRVQETAVTQCARSDWAGTRTRKLIT